MTDQPIAGTPPAAAMSHRPATGAKPLIVSGETLPALSLTPEELDRQRIVGFNSRDRRARPYHLLRTQIGKIMARNDWRMIGITSATPAAGKTFTSVNIAATLAATADSDVILCDLDFRRGSIGEMLNYVPDHGLGDYLAGNIADPHDVALRINDSKLVVLPTKPCAGSSTELLTTENFRTLMDRLHAMPAGAKMIFDLPPVFADDDAMICMEYLDAYLMVIDHGITTARQIEEGVRLLDPSPCVGTVLNRYKGGFADPYGYGYGDVYGMKRYN
ncbi:MAG: CpsD/CapB family tyrosine-protein kinase [Sphingomonas sp.]|uniref:CpsD/CapB family tyrosine-protein kinase n=1 Tax=Sphingomonas sp. TaxID=28214 RepID=UPI001AC6CA7F|nr:CpsD/CapB family tyrosine-protein kinase [Sphingomonas sp.]MBN8808856.1 CpsD/CapB family tyrosine-protein kinase [Sphingomonas sp.]